MADTQGIKAGRAYVEIGADESKLKKGLNAASGYLKALGVSIAGIGAMMGAAGGTISASLLDATNAFRQQGAELSRANQLTGINVERLSAMGYAAQQLGGDLEDVTHGMSHMANFLREVRDGSSSAQETISRLGISTHELLNMDLEDAYYRLGSATNALTSRTERLIVARQILGRHGVGTMGVFGAGRERMEQLGEEGRKNGQVMNTGDVAAAVMLNRQWKQMLGSLQALKVAIGAGMAPQWEFLLNLIKGGADLLTRFIKGSGELVPWLDKIATGLTVGGTAFVALGAGLGISGMLLRQFYPLASAAWSAISFGVGIVTTLGSTLLSVAAAPFQMAFSAFTGLASIAWTAATAVAGAMISVAGSVISGSASFAMAILGGIGSAIGFLISAVIGALPSVMTLVGAIGLASGAAAAGSGPMAVLNAFLAGLGITSGGTSGFMGVLATAVLAAAVAEEIGLGATGSFGAALTVLGANSAIVGFVLGLLSPILAMLGINLGVATTGTLAFKIGTWLANAAVTAFNVVVAIGEALTGSWIVPVALLAGAFALLAFMLLAPIALGGTLIGVLGALAIVAGTLAVSLGAILFLALLPAIMAAIVATVALAAAVVGALVLAWDHVKAAAVATWNWIKDTAASTWDWIKETAGAAWDWIGARAVSLWDTIKGVAATTWNWIAGVASSTWDSIVGVAMSAWEQISAVGSRLGEIFGTIFESIQTGNLEDALNVAWAAIKLGWIQTVAVLEDTWLTVKYFFVDTWTAAWNGMLNAAQAGWAYFMYGLRAGWIEVVRYARLALSYADPTVWGEAAEQARRAIDVEAERQLAAARGQRDEGVAGANRATGPDEAEQARREQERAGIGEGEDAAQEELEFQRSMADVNSQIARMNQAEQRARLEQRLQGQGGGAGDRGGAGATIHGTFSGAALAGLNIGGRLDAQQNIADETRGTREATEGVQDAVQQILALLVRGGGLPTG